MTSLDSKKYKSLQKVLRDPSSLSLESSLVLSGEWMVCAWQTTRLEDSRNPGRPKGTLEGGETPTTAAEGPEALWRW